MLVPKKERLAVYSELFKEGILVAKKGVRGKNHQELEVPNIVVIQLMNSLKSRGYVKESFCWRWYYWNLTDEGIEYLRNYLHLPEDIIPATHKKATAARLPGSGAPEAEGKDVSGRDYKPSFQKRV